MDLDIYFVTKKKNCVCPELSQVAHVKGYIFTSHVMNQTVIQISAQQKILESF